MNSKPRHVASRGPHALRLGLFLTLIVAAALPARAAVSATLPASEMDAIVKNLASNDFPTREAAQKNLNQVPAAQYAELIARANASADPEVKARLMARVEKLAPELEAAGGETAATLKIARLLTMFDSGPDPRGTMNAKRQELAREISALGDVAIKPLQDALASASTATQGREITAALGATRTVRATMALLGLLTEKDDAIRQQAIRSLTDRLGTAAEEGGSNDILPALAKALPGEKDESMRWQICASLVRVRTAPKADAALMSQVIDLLRAQLKNDGSANVRMWAAIAMSELGDNSGAAELKTATLAMQSGNAAAYETAESLGLPLHRLIPALERATGQTFGPVPMDPGLSSDMNAKPGLKNQRQELLNKVAAWIKANPTTAPTGATTLPVTGPGR